MFEIQHFIQFITVETQTPKPIERSFLGVDLQHRWIFIEMFIYLRRASPER